MSKANPRFRRTNPTLPPITGAVYNIIVGGTGEAGIWLMNIGYMAGSFVQTAISESNLAANWLLLNAGALRNVLSNIYSLNFCKVVCVSVPARQPFTNTTSALLGAGNVLIAPMPSTNAFVFTKQTAVRGQHGRGRNYIPGIPGTFIAPAVDPDRVTPAALLTYGLFAGQLLPNVLTDGAVSVTLAVFTRVLRGLPVTNAAFVTSERHAALLGTVRRRRVGRGK